VKPKISYLVSNITVLFLGLFFSFVLLEVALRIFWNKPKEVNKPKYQTPFWAPSGADEAQVSLHYEDPILGWRHRPGASVWLRRSCFTTFVSLNFMGTRDEVEEFNAESIVLLGDSFMEGLQVNTDKLFDKLLEIKIEVPVLNFGVSGYGPDQYLEVYKRVKDIIPHRAVVVAMYVGNDIRNVSRYLEEMANGHRSSKKFFGESNNDTSQVSVPASLSESNDAIPLWKRIGRLFSIYHFVGGQLHELGILKRPLPVDWQLYLYPPDPQWEKAWDTVKQVLLDLHREVGEKPMLVMIIPDRLEVAPENMVKREMRKYRIPTSLEFRLDWPRSNLKLLLREMGIPFIDLTPALTTAVRKQGFYSVYLPCDSHWSEQGHAVAADVVANYILRTWSNVMGGRGKM